MENNELPKKLTPEEIEQQKQNLEQNKEIEGPKEKDDPFRVSEIDAEISKKEKNIEETKKKINDIRNKLGLSQSDEIPPSIQSQKDDIEKLNEEKGQLNYPLIEKNLEDIAKEKQKINDKLVFNPDKKMFEFSSKEDEDRYRKLEKLQNAGFNGNFDELNKTDILNTNYQENSNKTEAQDEENSEEKQRFERNVKTVLENFSNESKTMLDALYERQQNRLTPIQSNDDFQRMVLQIKNLGNFESKINIDSLQEIIDNVKKLKNSFQEFRIMQSGGQIREDSNNLEKLSFGAKKFSNSVSESGSKLPTEMQNKELEEKSRELKSALKALAEDSQKLWILAVRMRDNFR